MLHVSAAQGHLQATDLLKESTALCTWSNRIHYGTFLLLWISLNSDVAKVKKKKVKLSLCLTNSALRHEDLWGSGCIDPHFLDLNTSWRWVVSFTHRPLYPRERAPSTHCIGGWVDPSAGLDDVEKRKCLTLPGLELRPLCSPARSQSLYRLSYPDSYSDVG
jgi:hypothetical protein